MTLGFKDTFVPAVVAGTKPHTIRAGERWRVGMSIQFYRRARQRDMAKIRPDAVATVVQQICVTHAGALDPLGPMPAYHERYIILIGEGRDRHVLTPLECQELARRDGFDDLDGLLRFIADMHGIPFTGQLVGWTDLKY